MYECSTIGYNDINPKPSGSVPGAGGGPPFVAAHRPEESVVMDRQNGHNRSTRLWSAAETRQRHPAAGLVLGKGKTTGRIVLAGMSDSRSR